MDKWFRCFASHTCRTTYSILNALAGHFNSFGPTTPIPKKRLERIEKVRALGASSWSKLNARCQSRVAATTDICFSSCVYVLVFITRACMALHLHASKSD